VSGHRSREILVSSVRHRTVPRDGDGGPASGHQGKFFAR
jgi:hypothetical protein